MRGQICKIYIARGRCRIVCIIKSRFCCRNACVTSKITLLRNNAANYALRRSTVEISILKVQSRRRSTFFFRQLGAHQATAINAPGTNTLRGLPRTTSHSISASFPAAAMLVRTHFVMTLSERRRVHRCTFTF